MSKKKFSLIAMLLIAMVFFSGCISTHDEPPASGEGEEINTQEEASDAVVEIGTAMNSLIAELEGIDEEIE